MKLKSEKYNYCGQITFDNIPKVLNYIPNTVFADKGFTGREFLADLNLYHMNG